ncbi:MAG: type ISP restriction/modification enzyme, partial [Gammaproteobacteria bacterium]
MSGPYPALTVSSSVPDLHYFSGRGAKDILPLYRDARGEQPNLHPELLRALGEAYRRKINAEDFGAYLYGVLAHSGYTDRFQAELANRQVRVPVTLERKLFEEACKIGKRLIYLHTYGERFANGQTWPQGRARCSRAVSTNGNIGLPEKVSYDPSEHVLCVGDGIFAPIDIAVWE